MISKSIAIGEVVRTEFIGVELGEFVLKGDDTSFFILDFLTVRKGQRTLALKGGDCLRVRLSSIKGVEYNRFQSHLTADQTRLLASLAHDLSGRLWPSTAEVLRDRIKKAGEKEVLGALNNLFKGVEATMLKVRLCRLLPFGERLFPVT